MKFFTFLILNFIILFTSCCKKAEDKCSNGYVADANNICVCPSGSIETYGQCLIDDNTTLFGVSDSCPCKKDSFLMVILGRTNTPNSYGHYQLNLQFIDTTGITTQTGMFFIPTQMGYDSIIEVGWPLLNRNCMIDGWSYQRQASGRIYGNDSLVLNFIYTRPNPNGSNKLIVASQTCGMVVRN
jgi:hypothetical protein